MPEQRKGVLFAIAAYVLWGFFPLYWPLLRPSGAVEILANRIVWSFLAVGVVLLALRRSSWLRAAVKRPRAWGLLAAAGVIITFNWGTYIYGVNSDQVVETSLGYFINPLVSVALGIVVLGERLRNGQWLAIGIGTLAVLVLTVNYGRLPWIALTLALTFGTYGLIKKKVGAPALEGLWVETGTVFIPMLGYIFWLYSQGQATLGQEGAAHALLLIGTAFITVIPLLFFAGAANRVPLSTIGILQYLAPVLQFGVGVVIFHEPMPLVRWIGFGLVWLALVVFTTDAIRHHRRLVLARTAESTA